uniref:Uncharacterized protein n=1 Tax=Seriola dumerili TaxID=41447 RepID=A0A3B4UW34_SERDU
SEQGFTVSLSHTHTLSRARTHTHTHTHGDRHTQTQTHKMSDDPAGKATVAHPTILIAKLLNPHVPVKDIIIGEALSVRVVWLVCGELSCRRNSNEDKLRLHTNTTSLNGNTATMKNRRLHQDCDLAHTHAHAHTRGNEVYLLS